MIFQDRMQAAEVLAAKLRAYRGARPLVLGVPRGGAPMAAHVAAELEGDLDVILVHKLRAPDQPEFAIGAVDESGVIYVSPAAQDLGIDDAYINQEAAHQLKEIRRRRELYTPGRGMTSLQDRVVIVVDDGVATGSTLLAALRAARRSEPKRLIAAVGVAPTRTLERLSLEADEVQCGATNDQFVAVGESFVDFSSVDDRQVQDLLQAATDAAPLR